MEHNQPSNDDVIREFSPLFPLWTRVMLRSTADAHAAVPILGIPKKVERAGDYHRATRENLRRLCDMIPELLELREGADGEGLDFMVCYLNPDQPKAVRWGRIPEDGRVRRNDTKRTKHVQNTGMLFDEMDEDTDEYPTFTLGYTIRNDFIEMGVPQWTLGSVRLLRERPWESEVIKEIAAFESPEDRIEEHQTPEPIIVAREEEEQLWLQMIEQLRNDAA